ncbi:hypothetical protein F4809DRAFT_615143, partial [Biscogniauxia mediterranea]
MLLFTYLLSALGPCPLALVVVLFLFCKVRHLGFRSLYVGCNAWCLSKCLCVYVCVWLFSWVRV